MSKSQFSGSVMYGDPIPMDSDDSASFQIGDVQFDADIAHEGEVYPTLEGAVGAIASAVKRAAITPIKSNVPATSPATAAAKTVVAAAQQVATGMPGAALSAAKLSPVIVSNAKIIAKGTNQLIPGWVLQNNISRFLAQVPWKNITATATISSGTATWDIGNSDWTLATNGFAIKTKQNQGLAFPIYFITIITSPLNAQAGQRLTLTLSTLFDEGLFDSTTDDTWVLERTTVGAPIQIAVIPYARTKDTIRPVIATAFRNLGTGLATGTYAISTAATFKVTVSGLSTTNDTAHLIIPGLDSTELSSFCNAWGLRF